MDKSIIHAHFGALVTRTLGRFAPKTTRTLGHKPVLKSLYLFPIAGGVKRAKGVEIEKATFRARANALAKAEDSPGKKKKPVNSRMAHSVIAAKRRNATVRYSSLTTATRGDYQKRNSRVSIGRSLAAGFGPPHGC